MVDIELADLKKVGKDIAEFLSERLKTEVAVRGNILVVSDEADGKYLGAKDVKLQLKHTLHHLGLSGEYKVLAEHHKIRIVEIHEKPHYIEHEGTPPTSSQTLPYLFP